MTWRGMLEELEELELEDDVDELEDELEEVEELELEELVALEDRVSGLLSRIRTQRKRSHTDPR